MTDPEYVLDSSFLIKLHREQPPDIYVSLWEAIANLLESGHAVVPREAARELERRDDDLFVWLKARSGGVAETSSEELEIVTRIAARFPMWVQGRKNAADPFVIAAALVRRAVIVTDERMAGLGSDERNLRIPNVAATYGATTILPTEMIRRCGWRF